MQYKTHGAPHSHIHMYTYFTCRFKPALTLVKLELECEGDLEALADKPAEKQQRKNEQLKKLS